MSTGGSDTAQWATFSSRLLARTLQAGSLLRAVLRDAPGRKYLAYPSMAVMKSYIEIKGPEEAPKSPKAKSPPQRRALDWLLAVTCLTVLAYLHHRSRQFEPYHAPIAFRPTNYSTVVGFFDQDDPTFSQQDFDVVSTV